MEKNISLLVAFTLIFILPTLAQNGQINKGPTIQDFGSTYRIENPDFRLNTSQVFKVVFDIHNTPDDPSAVNPMLNTLARFINMHTQAGVPLENLKVAGVFHNKASKDVFDNASYKEKFGVDNPNIPLMEALVEAGAKLYMCGQSMHARGVPKEKMAEPIQTALSAMTVILSLQNEGYQLIKF